MPNLTHRLALPAFTTRNRVFMAPLTRMRAAQPGDVPTDLMREYYTQRAGAGLIVTEGTQISPGGKGYHATPGIHSEEQVAGWRRITDAVHEAGGRIALQLWHVGRITHPAVHGGEPGVSASALPFEGTTRIQGPDGNLISVDAPTPRALAIDELPRVADDYHRATLNARAAGFDMVEIHGANGYLLQQFMSTSSNHREDQYGGSLDNRARFPLEVVDAVVDAWDPAHVGMRISPMIKARGLDDSDGLEMGLYIAGELNRRELGYLHLAEPDWDGGPALDDDFRIKLREAYDGVIIAAGNYTPDKSARILRAGWADAIAFGRLFIANPDLPRRLAVGSPFNELRPEVISGGGATGYTDYPSLIG
ncbi:alkene reductase [Streptomyces mirabilis]|uniref:alkene reductase n=1 Tax=Streptomyces mirabilis TaxID=68239 RepID=UPI0033FC4F50